MPLTLTARTIEALRADPLATATRLQLTDWTAMSSESSLSRQKTGFSTKKRKASTNGSSFQITASRSSSTSPSTCPPFTPRRQTKKSSPSTAPCRTRSSMRSTMPTSRMAEHPWTSTNLKASQDSARSPKNSSLLSDQWRPKNRWSNIAALWKPRPCSRTT